MSLKQLVPESKEIQRPFNSGTAIFTLQIVAQLGPKQMHMKNYQRFERRKKRL